MIKEYPTKHSEYSVILQEKERQRIAKEYSVSILVMEAALQLCFFILKKEQNIFCVLANAAAKSSEG